jgi:RHS repeat-associated protein
VTYFAADGASFEAIRRAEGVSSAGGQENLPFGTALDTDIAGNTRRFTSYDRSGTTKLDYAVNRFYNAGLGRFTQVDPIGMGAANLVNPQSLNLYGYCENDPVNRLDPDGLSWRGFFRAIGNFFKRLFGSGPGRPKIKLPGVTTPPFNPNAGSPSFGGNGSGGGSGSRGKTPPFNPNAGTGVSGVSSFLAPRGGSLQTSAPFDWALLFDVLRAGAALLRDSCRGLFSKYVNPVELLGTLHRGDTYRGSIRRGDLGVGVTSGGTTITPAADTTGISASRMFVGRGHVGHLAVRQAYWIGANITLNSNAASPYQGGYRGRYGVDDATNRAITLIHELGHAAALIYGDDASRIVDDISNPTRSEANSRLVYENCFR